MKKNLLSLHLLDFNHNENEKLKIPSFKRQYMQNSIFYKSVKYYNSLPLELRTASDLKTFYKNVKTHFNII
jgi:hypothetical protein